MSVSVSSPALPPDYEITPQEEKDFLDAARRVFAGANPNPQRIGCPGDKAPKALARHQDLPGMEKVVSHVGKCSPCFKELDRYTQQHKASRRWLRIAALVLILGGVSLWISFRIFHPRGPQKDSAEPAAIGASPPAAPPLQSVPGVRVPLPEAQAMVVDLRKYSVTRGLDNLRWKEVVLPRGRLKLTIYLPIGSEEGEYEIAIFRQEDFPIVQNKGTASLQKYVAVLDVEVDTTSLSAGHYTLGIRQHTTKWSEYPLQLK